jgi:hypothetical protein
MAALLGRLRIRASSRFIQDDESITEPQTSSLNAVYGDSFRPAILITSRVTSYGEIPVPPAVIAG